MTCVITWAVGRRSRRGDNIASNLQVRSVVLGNVGRVTLR